MEQVYWLSHASTSGSLPPDTRTLVYVYGRFVYTGDVITEPVRGTEYLPAVLQGVQAVQGQVPYMCETSEIPGDSLPAAVVRTLTHVCDAIHAELTSSATTELLARAAEAGATWLDDDNAALYFEFEARNGHDCCGADVVFLKRYYGDVLMTLIWYGPAGVYYVCLSPAGEEQALVDTLFPSIYGKRRGMRIGGYTPGSDGTPAGVYNGEDAIGRVGPARMFSGLSVWEASESVPDPDAIAARDEAEAAAEAAAVVEAAEEAARMEAGEVQAAAGTIDVSGGNGYTQVYAVMAPMKGVTTTTTRNGLVPRSSIFRFGDWVYAGTAEFPVDSLQLGDVPYVLPALQKQQGRLGYLSEARAFPAEHPLAPTMQSFMSAIALLQQEMIESQDEVAELATQGINAWIDEDWSASFFEMTLDPTAIPEGLQGVEVIASKVYVTASSGVILHVVYFEGSLYCVLADSVEDLPLLDVAFPDVTARNRVVQVRTYNSTAAKKLAAAHGGVGVCPLPRSLRVWEGRRRGVPGVGFGAVSALSDGAAAAAAIREKARARAEAEAKEAAAAATVKPAEKTKPVASTARVADSESKSESKMEAPASRSAPREDSAESKVDVAPAVSAARSAVHTARSQPAASSAAAPADAGDDDLYDMTGVPASRLGRAAAGAASRPISESKTSDASDSKVADASSSSKPSGVAASSLSSLPPALLHTVARAPHHLAPLAGAPAGNRLATSTLDAALAGTPDTDAAPWDASGRPRKL